MSRKPWIGDISTHTDVLGDPDGILLTIGHKQLVIDLLDAYGSRTGGAHVSLELAKRMLLPDVTEAAAVMCNIEAVNEALIKLGGQPIDGSYYTREIKDGCVQIFGYKDGGWYSYPVPVDSPMLPCKYKVRQIKTVKG